MRGHLLPVLLTALLCATGLQAQEELIVNAELVGDPTESYDPARAKVSGPPLVGLRLGSRDGNVNPEKINPESLFVVRPPSLDSTICIRATTQDARYSTSNRYQILKKTPKAKYVRLQPLTKKYAETLRSYDNNKFAIRAYATFSPDCAHDEIVHLPVSAQAPFRLKDAELIVFANGRSQLGQAMLYAAGSGTGEPQGDLLASKDCTRAGAASLIAYDLLCRLAIPDGASGRMLLVLEFNDGFKSTAYRFAVYLPDFDE